MSISVGNSVKVTSPRGSLILKAKVTGLIYEKNLFVPLSKKSDYNHSAAGIQKH